jgi:alpha-L-rhamnosidase
MDKNTKASVKAINLRCEYLENPIGIDVTYPRLSWQLKSVNPDDRGQRQTAYHIFVSSSLNLLDKDQGDIWNSGEVSSDQSLHIVCDKLLNSGTKCFWKVRIRDENGNLSDWSDSAQWTMGLLDKWQAKWIGTDQINKGNDNTIVDPFLRKSFSLDKKPEKANIYVASVGYHELYVNGKRVGDAVLMPSVVDHTKRARYITYEIADYLNKGKNVIALWLGVGWSIYQGYKTEDKPQTPIVIAQAEIDDIKIVTDESWKWHPSPNMLIGAWFFTNYGGELYDANKEIDGWSEADFDDSSWKPVSVYNPNLKLSSEMVEPNRIIQEISPISIEERDGEYRVDMGINFNGWVEIDVKGEQGKRIDFQFSERHDQAMVHQLRSAYIIGSSGKGTFQNRFNYMTGRWVTIKGLDYKPSLKDIRGHLIRTNYKRAGWFECSNKLLNDIYNMTLWTFENLSLGGYVVDCPHRERMGYGGDAHATTEPALNNYHLGAFYTKWAEDWRDTQKEDGILPHTAPTYWGGGGVGWCGYCITLPWWIYEYYGDTRILEVNFPTMQKWLSFLETKSSNNMLVRYGGEWDFLGDWLWPGAQGVNGDTRETLFFNNCYWIYNLQIASMIAQLIGKDDYARIYQARAEVIKKAVHEEFFSPEGNSYVDGLQAYLSIALLVDLPPSDLRTKVMKRLEDEILIHRKGHFWAGITGGYFVIRALLDNHRPDLIFKMATKEDYPGWGDMLKKGATTFWESWEGDISLLHSSYLHIGLLFTQGIGGIYADSPGFKSFIIKPGIIADLDWAKTKYDSIYGTIVSEWKKVDGKLIINVTVPPNTTAKLLMPTTNAQSITENGQPLSQAIGVKHHGSEEDQAILLLDPGSYVFESDLGDNSF